MNTICYKLLTVSNAIQEIKIKFLCIFYVLNIKFTVKARCNFLNTFAIGTLIRLTMFSKPLLTVVKPIGPLLGLTFKSTGIPMFHSQ